MIQAHASSDIGGIVSMIKPHRAHSIGRLIHCLLRVKDSIYIIFPGSNTFLDRLCQFGRTETADAAS